MDYEKKYKEALELARVAAFNGHQSLMEGIFPELAESEEEKTRKAIIEYLRQRLDRSPSIPAAIGSWIAWLEKQVEKPSVIRWYNVSLIPQEMEELLVEWDSEDATWHEIAFYHADTKTFWNGTRQVENVTRWCYIIDLLEKQGENTYNKELPELLHKVICRFINDPNIPYSDREKVSMKVLPYVERLEKQGEQKPAWNEKDEKEYKYVLKFVDNILNNCGNKKDYEHCKRCYDWLKSLKQKIGDKQ